MVAPSTSQRAVPKTKMNNNNEEEEEEEEEKEETQCIQFFHSWIGQHKLDRKPFILFSFLSLSLSLCLFVLIYHLLYYLVNFEQH